MSLNASFCPDGTYEQLRLPSQKIDTARLIRLNNARIARVTPIFLECFSDKPELFNLLTHAIKVTPEFKPKQFKSYTVPEILKGEID